MVVEGTRVKGKDEDEMKRKRKCALSCLNENKQLSDSLRTFKKEKKHVKLLRTTLFLKKQTKKHTQLSIRKQQ